MDPGKSDTGKETTTSPQIVTNEPLLTLGPTALNAHDTPALKEVSLSHYTYAVKGVNDHHVTVAGPDLPDNLPHLLPINATITSSTYDVTRQGADKAHKCTIISGGKVICEDPVDKTPFLQHCVRKGFCHAASALLTAILAFLPAPFLEDDDPDQVNEDTHQLQPVIT